MYDDCKVPMPDWKHGGPFEGDACTICPECDEPMVYNYDASEFECPECEVG